MDWKTGSKEDSSGHKSASLLLHHRNQNGNHRIDGQAIEEDADDSPDVVIIGNGPSAICLSYLLSGNWPFLNGCEDATLAIDEGLQARLQNVHKDLSLVEQDLAYLSDGLEGRSPNPVALLFDFLANPGADIGARLPSMLRWHFSGAREVPHVVLGKKQVGGIWQNQNEQKCGGRTKTVSLGSWMELPGMSLKDWLSETNSNRHRQTNSEDSFRASMADISGYYREYVRRQRLSKYFRNQSTVTSLNRLAAVGPSSLDCESGEVELGFDCPHRLRNDVLWEVGGYRTTYDSHLGEERVEEFRYVTPNVVLATGAFDVPLTLGVPGEHLPFVVHSFHDLEKLLEKTSASCSDDPVVVVGGGLTAADAILMLGARKTPTVHIHRLGTDAPYHQQQQLSAKIYPEYHEVYRLMMDSSESEWYSGYSGVDVVSFAADGDVVLRCRKTGTETTVRASAVAVLVGSRPDLSFVCPSVLRDLGVERGNGGGVDGKRNFVDVRGASYESLRHPGLYALGPLVGDQMVRFIRGGALAVASHVWSKRQEKKKTSAPDGGRLDDTEA